MRAAPELHAITGYGIELEYMIVDRHTLAVMPIADALLQAVAGSQVSSVDRGNFGWSRLVLVMFGQMKQ